MKIIGLDGKFYTWSLLNHRVMGDDLRPRSELHLKGRALLKQFYPTEPLLEEVYLPGSLGLYMDFFLPNRGLVVELQGEQHYRYVAHFHQNQAGFVQSKRRDQNKRDWCKLNKFTLVELPFNEDLEQWKTRLMQL